MLLAVFFGTAGKTFNSLDDFLPTLFDSWFHERELCERHQQEGDDGQDKNYDADNCGVEE